MTRDTWKDIIEIVGLVAIVGSLVFLALEVRQNTTALKAGAWQVRSDTLLDLSLEIANSPTLAAIRSNLLHRPPTCADDDPICSGVNFEYVKTLGPVEFEQYRAYLRAHAFRLQNMTVQYQYGLLTDAYYESGVIGAIELFMPRWEAFQVPQGLGLQSSVDEFKKRR